MAAVNRSKCSKTNKSPATVNRHLTTLKHMFTKAVEWEMVEEEVLKKVRRVKLLPENDRRLRYLSAEECRKLVAACDAHLRPIVITAINTGMRKEEILSLEWEKNIDLVHGFILLTQTKNGERREVPINATLRTALQGIVRRLDSSYVFVNGQGRRYKDVKRSFGSSQDRDQGFQVPRSPPHLRQSPRDGGGGYHHGQGSTWSQDAHHDPSLFSSCLSAQGQRPVGPRRCAEPQANYTKTIQSGECAPGGYR
jgi:integrase